MPKLLQHIAVILLGLISMNASAKLAGKNVILVHGFISTDINQNRSDSQLLNGAKSYWQDYWRGKVSNVNKHILYWPSAERVEGKIKDKIRSQLIALGNDCINGCIFVTHSTGDLVTRYMLKNLGAWGLSNKVKVDAVIDFAGAGGGTKLAEIAVAISEGSGAVNSAQRWAVQQALQFTPQKGKMGVMYDLVPSKSRSIATGYVGVPRLRYVGTGTEFAGATKPFLTGKSDSVVAMHSACGAANFGDYQSCVGNVANNGELKSVRGAGSLWANHYPILMGEKTTHGGTINNNKGSEFTTVNNNKNYGGLNVSFATKTERKWWSGGRNVRWVRYNNQWGSNYSMSNLVYNELN
ncbi:hypothetical protein ACFSJY_08130 [Thalassotalea euphylliae]|uniref:hypothetical protein n=1 Tax=Thalassotalea euphylliae TaxID=1655234 RepID=UPI0036369D5A